MVITDNAKAYIEEAMKEAGMFTLRFGFAGQGCCGPNYQMALEGPMDKDVIHQVNLIQVAVDPQVADLVNGITVDYTEDSEGAGLIISGGESCC